MGRQLRRVPLDFKWELNKVWKGFVNPYDNYDEECEECEGLGLNKSCQEIWNSWYDSDGFNHRWSYEYVDGRASKIVENYPGACRRWCDKLTQDEVDALVEEGRFYRMTHTWSEELRDWLPKEPLVKVTAEMVNALNGVGSRSFGHDACNQSICCRTRAKRLGVYGNCEACNGNGRIVFDEETKKLSEEWTPTPVPSGEGWQVWETVSEGSPVTPVFTTKENLIEYMVKFQGISRPAATTFVESKNGWVPSGVFIDNKGYVSGIESAVYLS